MEFTDNDQKMAILSLSPQCELEVSIRTYGTMGIVPLPGMTVLDHIYTVYTLLSRCSQLYGGEDSANRITIHKWSPGHSEGDVPSIEVSIADA